MEPVCILGDPHRYQAYSKHQFSHLPYHIYCKILSIRSLHHLLHTPANILEAVVRNQYKVGDLNVTINYVK